MAKDFYAQTADIYDERKYNVRNVENIGNAIKSRIQLLPEMHIVDFGAGTGLLLEQIAPYVSKITAVDVSPAMNRVLAEKQENLPCELDIREVDLTSEVLIDRFDGIISSMTMHHIADIRSMFGQFYTMLKPGGFIAIADLDSEDGSFHTQDTGFIHAGFERDVIAAAASDAGFVDVSVDDASVVHKPHGDFPVFLLTGKRNS